jgi:hypothetical protein
MPPFLFTYQLDLALHPMRLGGLGLQLGGKANRIAEEANRIRLGRKHHWFGCEYLPWAPWWKDVESGMMGWCGTMARKWEINRGHVWTCQIQRSKPGRLGGVVHGYTWFSAVFVESPFPAWLG